MVYFYFYFYFYFLSMFIQSFAMFPLFHYHKKKKFINPDKPLYDIGHNMIKENYDFLYFSDIVGLYFILLCLYLYYKKNYYVLNKLLFTISIVFILRSISINLTYLPLPKKCNNKPPFINGGCGDLMFSGHYCYFTSILYVCILKLDLNIYIKIFVFVNFLLSIINSLRVRNHYSVDIFISIILTYLSAEKIFT